MVPVTAREPPLRQNISVTTEILRLLYIVTEKTGFIAFCQQSKNTFVSFIHFNVDKLLESVKTAS